ncbi:hypothetical protein Tco_1052160 [Tanacetum coccineum]
MSLRPRAYGMVSMRGEKKGGRGQEGIMSKACGACKDNTMECESGGGVNPMGGDEGISGERTGGGSVFESMESELCEPIKQNELLNDRLMEATLTHDVEKYVLIHSENKNDTLSVEIEKI